MQTKTNIQSIAPAGASLNHNEGLVVQAAGTSLNHNEGLVVQAAVDRA